MADEPLPEVTPADEAAMREGAPAEPVETPVVPEAPQVAPEVEKAPEAKPEAKAEDEKKRDVVPLATLLEERKEAKDRERRMEDRFQQFVQRFAPKPEETKPAVPDFDTDPLGAIKHDRETSQQRMDRLEQRFQAEDQRTQLRSFVEGHEAEFRKTAPDYDAAIAHVVASRGEELAMLGANPEQIRATLQQEAQTIAMVAAQNGKNPAEVMYGFAKTRGYRKAEAKPETEARSQVETLQRGAAASRSLGTAGGSPAESGLTLKALADMPLEDFAKISDKDFERAMTRAQ